MVQHALDRGYDVVAVCREQSVGKLAEFDDRIETRCFVTLGPSSVRRSRGPQAFSVESLVRTHDELFQNLVRLDLGESRGDGCLLRRGKVRLHKHKPRSRRGLVQVE